MKNLIFQCLKYLSPPRNGDDPYCWRLSVFWALLIIAIICVGGMLAMHGALAWVGIDTRVAWTNELNERIESSLAPMQQQMDGLKNQITEIQSTSSAILRAQYLPQIREKVRQRCDTRLIENPRLQAIERSKINRDIDRIRAEYKILADEPLDHYPTCDEV